MSTLFLDDGPQVRGRLARRRELDQDGRGEVWEGVHHVAPHEHGRNGRGRRGTPRRAGPCRPLGWPHPWRFARPRGTGRLPRAGRGVPPRPDTAPAPLDRRAGGRGPSPRDEAFATFGFHAARGVDELWVVDPLQRTVRTWQRRDGDHAQTGRSTLLGLTADQVERAVHWSPV